MIDGVAILARAQFNPANCPGNVCVTDGLVKKIFGYSVSINDLWSTLLAAAIVAGMGLYLARKATSGVPGKLQLAWETVVGAIQNQVAQTIGPEGRKVVPLAVTLFMFILVANWLELFWPAGHNPNYIPTPTSNVNIDYAMALTVFVFTNATAIKRAGLKRYFGHFLKPYSWMTLFNVVEEIAKPVSLSLRLFGNVFAGALILALIAGLFPLFIVPFADLVWVPFDLFIFAIQAFIFAVLTLIYYQQAIDVARGGGH
ncbi:MAG: F0F1 ATP synthase subunit A [Acidimicrobiales bacterium]